MRRTGSLILTIVRLGIHGFSTPTVPCSAGCLKYSSHSHKRALMPMRSSASSGLIDHPRVHIGVRLMDCSSLKPKALATSFRNRPNLPAASQKPASLALLHSPKTLESPTSPRPATSMPHAFAASAPHVCNSWTRTNAAPPPAKRLDAL